MNINTNIRCRFPYLIRYIECLITPFSTHEIMTKGGQPDESQGIFLSPGAEIGARTRVQAHHQAYNSKAAVRRARAAGLILMGVALLFSVGCWGTEDDPIEDIYSYNAAIETTLTGTLIAGTGLVDDLHVDTITYSNGYWDDVRTPVTAVKTSATKPPDWINYSAGQVLSFGDEAIAGNEESVSFLIQFPHGKEANSFIEMHVHYVLPVAAAGNQVRWKLEYSWASIGAVLPATQTLYALTSATADADTHYMASFGFIDGTGKGMSSMLIGTLTRNSSDALDNYANDAYLLEIDAHYQMDRPGSEEYDH